MSSIRVILGLVASLDLECEKLDVKTTFLNGYLKEEIYMEQPDGFKERGKENLVCKLKKSLYGLNMNHTNGIRNLIHLCWNMVLKD